MVHYGICLILVEVYTGGLGGLVVIVVVVVVRVGLDSVKRYRYWYWCCFKKNRIVQFHSLKAI